MINMLEDTQTTRNWFDFFREYGFIIGALSGSLAAYLLGLIVSHLKREKRWVGFSKSGRTIVERGHADLSFTFRGREIDRLDSHEISVRNIGNQALLDQPIRIQTPDGEIVAFEVDRPTGATYGTSQPDGRSVVIDCELLNPGEVFTVGVTVVNSTVGELFVSARGERLVCKEIGGSVNSSELLGILAGTSSLTKIAFDVTKALGGLR